MRLIGIDPSLTATGLALIDVSGPTVVLLARSTVKAGTPDMQLSKRLNTLAANVEGALLDYVRRSLADCGIPLGAIVLEDPTDQVHIGKDRARSPASIAKLGAATGALMLVAPKVASFAGALFQAIPAGMWIPKERGHPVKQEIHLRTLRALIRGGREAEDDELMAAGVAWFYARDLPRPAALRANYDPVPRRRRSPLRKGKAHG